MAPDELEQRVEFRLRRERILDREDGSTLWAVVDEAALRRLTGGADVMREQIEHLIAMSSRRNIVLQVVPFHLGGHAGAGGPFTILRFAGQSEVQDVVYLEQLTSALYLDKRADVDDYITTMELLCVQALPPRETVEFLEDLRTQLTRPDGPIRSNSKRDVNLVGRHDLDLIENSSLGAPAARELIARTRRLEIE